MKKKGDEDLSMFEDAKQFVSVLVPTSEKSIPNALKKFNANKPKFVNIVNREMLKKLAIEQGKLINLKFKFYLFLRFKHRLK